MEGDKEKIWFVIDANIVFSALIKDDSLTGKIIFSDRFSLFFPEDGLVELNKYEPYILKKRSNYKQKLSYDYLLSCIFEVVEVVPSKYYEDKIKEARGNFLFLIHKLLSILSIQRQWQTKLSS